MRSRRFLPSTALLVAALAGGTIGACAGKWPTKDDGHCGNPCQSMVCPDGWRCNYTLDTCQPSCISNGNPPALGH